MRGHIGGDRRSVHRDERPQRDGALHLLCRVSFTGAALPDISRIELTVRALLGLVVFTASLWLLVAFPRFIAQSVGPLFLSDKQGAHFSAAKEPTLKSSPGCSTSKSSTLLGPSSGSSTPRVCSRCPSMPSPGIRGSTHRRELQPFLLPLYIACAPLIGRFWTDVLFTIAYFSGLTSTIIAIMILLPRSMADEAGATKTAQVYVNRPPQQYQTYRKSSLPLSSESGTSADAESIGRSPENFINFSDTPHRNTLAPWDALGERLNIHHEALGEFRQVNDHGESAEMFHVPFAAQPGDRRLAEGEEIHHVPRQVSQGHPS